MDAFDADELNKNSDIIVVNNSNKYKLFLDNYRNLSSETMNFYPTRVKWVLKLLNTS